MSTVRWIISAAPEIFLLLSVALGTILGRVRIRCFSIGTTACTLIVAVLIGQLGTFTFPSLLRVIPSSHCKSRLSGWLCSASRNTSTS